MDDGVGANGPTYRRARGSVFRLVTLLAFAVIVSAVGAVRFARETFGDVYESSPNGVRASLVFAFWLPLLARMYVHGGGFFAGVLPVRVEITASELVATRLGRQRRIAIDNIDDVKDTDSFVRIRHDGRTSTVDVAGAPFDEIVGALNSRRSEARGPVVVIEKPSKINVWGVTFMIVAIAALGVFMYWNAHR